MRVFWIRHRHKAVVARLGAFVVGSCIPDELGRGMVDLSQFEPTMGAAKIRVRLLLHPQPFGGDGLGQAASFFEVREPGLEFDIAQGEPQQF